MNHQNQTSQNEKQDDDSLVQTFTLSPEAQILFNELPNQSRLYLNNALHKLSQEQIDAFSEESWISMLTNLARFGEFAPAIMHVTQQNHDLRNDIIKGQKSTKLLFIIIIFCILAILILGALLAVYPKNRIIQTVDNTAICEIPVKDNPMLTDIAVADFAKQAVLSAYSFDYTSSTKQIQDSTSRYFSQEGRNNFITALKQSGSLDYILNNNLIMKTTSLADPQVDEKGISNVTGKAYWIVRMPIRVNFYTGGRDPEDSKTYLAEIRITQTPRDAFNVNGIGVYSLTYSPYKFSNK